MRLAASVRHYDAAFVSALGLRAAQEPFSWELWLIEDGKNLGKGKSRVAKAPNINLIALPSCSYRGQAL